MVWNRTHINVCVSVCVVVSAACSKPHSDGVVSQFTSSDSCIRAALKKEACSFASQSDMGLTPSNRFLDSVHVRDFWGLRFLFSASFILKWIWKKRNGYMSYDNFAYSCNWGWPGWPWVGAMLIVKKKNDRKKERWAATWRNVRKEWREKEQDLDRGGTSHSLKIESIWKVCFSATQMCINWPHHITGPSEWDRVSVRGGGGRQKSHMKGDGDYISHSSLQFSIIKIVFTWKFDLLLWPIVTYCLPYFFFSDRK